MISWGKLIRYAKYLVFIQCTRYQTKVKSQLWPLIFMHLDQNFANTKTKLTYFLETWTVSMTRMMFIFFQFILMNHKLHINATKLCRVLNVITVQTFNSSHHESIRQSKSNKSGRQVTVERVSDGGNSCNQHHTGPNILLHRGRQPVCVM